MAAGDLTTLANVKAWLGITNTTDDAQLSRLITAASDFIINFTNRSFALQSVTNKLYNGNGNSMLVLRNYPLVSVESLSIDGVAFDSSKYAFSGRTIYLLNGYVFTQGSLNVSVSYTGGYATIPPSIEQCCIELIALKYRERERIGHESKSLGGETTAFMIRDLHPNQKAILLNLADKVPA